MRGQPVSATCRRGKAPLSDQTPSVCGGAHERHLRTRFTQSFDVAVLQDDWNENAVLLHPGNLRQQLLTQASGIPVFRYDPSKHVLEVAIEWKQQIAMNQHISSADIATQVGLTSGRVRQILRFTNLHLNVQKSILELVRLRGRKAVPERLLRQLQKALRVEQPKRFEKFLRIDGDIKLIQKPLYPADIA